MKLESAGTIAPDYSVRPVFRVLGGLFCGGFALVFFYQAAMLVQHEGPAVAKCRPGKGRLWCELGDWMVTALPTTWQSPTLAIVSAAMGAALLFAAWWLLRPLVVRSHGRTSART